MEFASGEDGTGSTGLENIWIAASEGDIARIQTLLVEGVSVNAQDETGYSAM